jgi:hypothetical protein
MGIIAGITIWIMVSPGAHAFHASDGPGASNQGKADESVESKVISLEQGAMERWRKGDPWGWAEISTEEVTYIDPGLTEPIIGLEEYKKYLKQFEGKIQYEVSNFIDPKTVRCGDCVVLTYNYSDDYPDDEVTDDNSSSKQNLWNTTEVYCLIDNEWKIIHTHWSYVKHGLPQRTVVPVPVEQTAKQYEGVLGDLMALESAAMERWRKGDPWGFTDISDQGVTYFDKGTSKRLDGLEALKAEYAKRVGKIHYDVMEFIDPRVQAHGDLAVLTYRFFSTELNPDGSIAGRIPWNCTEVFCKKDTKWRIIHTHWSYINGERR